jgi:iron complex outermembrane receptor protein
VHRTTGVSGAVGAIWQWAPSWSVAAHLSTAWRPPSVNERHSYGVHHGTAQFEIGDEALTAERMTGLDVTLRHVSDGWTAEVSGYLNGGTGFIHLYPTGDTLVTVRGVFPAFRHQQAAVRLAGLDGQIEGRLTQALSAGVTGSLLRATHRDRREPLVDMPADRIGAHLGWHHPDAGPLRDGTLRLEGTWTRRQTRVPPDVNLQPPPPGYALAALRYDGTLQWGRYALTWGLSVYNLLNTPYRDYLSRFRAFTDAPGRSITLRVRVPFGGSTLTHERS